MKQHTAPQFDLPGTSEPFNLTGEILTQPEPPPPPKTDNTLDIPCAKKAYGFMPACVLPAGHNGPCCDQFGGIYHHGI